MILLICIIIVVLIIFHNMNYKQHTENFRNDNKVLDNLKLSYSNNIINCPDYLAYDGIYYYLVNNKTHKIETFNTLIEAHKRLETLKCPKYNPISLVKKNNNDPQVGIDRKCAKKVSINKFIEDIYNFSISEENRTDKNLNKDLDILEKELPGYLKDYNIQDFLGNNTPKYLNNSKEEIKNSINNYIKNANPKELSNYLNENCMINEYVAEYKGTHGDFYDNYNSINIIDELKDNQLSQKDIVNNNLDSRKDIEYKLMNEVWNINKPITNLMMDKLFSV
jgi:hypothetical protein